MNDKCSENCLGGDETTQCYLETRKCLLWTAEMETNKSVPLYTWLKYSVNAFYCTRLAWHYTFYFVLPSATRERRWCFHCLATKIISNEAMSSTTLHRTVKPPLRSALYKTTSGSSCISITIQMSISQRARLCTGDRCKPGTGQEIYNIRLFLNF